MATEFKYLVFSVFGISDFGKFTDAVKDLFDKELRLQKAKLLIEIPNFEEYINPKSGGAHMPKFCFWKNSMYPNKVFFISNYEDGLSNVCRAIQRRLKCSYVMCALSEGIKNPFYKFYYSNSFFEERLVQTYKNPQWVFYEEGTPLLIENTIYYRNRFIKDRLNNTIIKEYMLKLGVDISLIDTHIIDSLVFIRKKW